MRDTTDTAVHHPGTDPLCSGTGDSVRSVGEPHGRSSRRVRRAARAVRLVTALAALAASVTVATAPASPAVAADPVMRYQGEHCHGREVVRCMWLNHDTANRRFAGYGHVRDSDGGRNWDVAVQRIEIQVNDGCPGSSWVGSRVVADHDGWFTNHDNAKTGLYDTVHPRRCANSTPLIRVKAYMSWKPAGAHWSAAVGEWKYSRTIADPRS